MILALAGCATTVAPPPQAPTPQAPATRATGSGISTATFQRVASRVGPVAVRLCRQENPQRPARYCDFRIAVDRSDRGSANAYQTILDDGRPLLAFNPAMLRALRNQDEVAFILGHEAAHQIRNHLSRRSTNASLGALILGGVIAGIGGSQTAVMDAANIGGSIGARAYSKDHEIEADIIGAYVSAIAGFNPERGARTFARIARGSDALLSTHPPAAAREAAVARTVARIKALQAAGEPINLP